MKENRKITSSIASVATLVLLLTILISVFAPVASANARTAGAPITFIAHKITPKPLYKWLGPASSARPRSDPQGKVLFPCQSNTNPTPILCYGPFQIRQAYGVNSLLSKGITGKGHAVTIIDAFGSPTLQSDFAAFDAAWGLPDATLNVIAPFGVNGSDFGWAIETTLDVEWAHAMAPGATINLVVAATGNDVDIYNAIKYAVDQNLGDTISQSFGENESCMDPTLEQAMHQVYHEAVNKGISVFAASSDSGSAQTNCTSTSLVEAVSYPASDPWVTAVGGTALTANAVTGKYIGETAWNESSTFGAASGGGYSVLFSRPNYQDGSVGKTPGRAVPDVALNASVNGGVLVFITDPSTGQLAVFIVGGTSVSSPEFAGIVTDGAQKAGGRLGFLNTTIYKLGRSAQYSASFNDITSGSNILLGSGVPGFMAMKKWDAVTGWGTPKDASILVANLIANLS
jgi:subtilase family serine protease